mmetsp:Transcript_19309/g.60694  ORF Transcript_19309/g.60694 Transcript_19309/m.60694 type:complete len:245 (+) Transcript_19309:27-761(+)
MVDRHPQILRHGPHQPLRIPLSNLPDVETAFPDHLPEKRFPQHRRTQTIEEVINDIFWVATRPKRTRPMGTPDSPGRRLCMGQDLCQGGRKLFAHWQHQGCVYTNRDGTHLCMACTATVDSVFEEQRGLFGAGDATLVYCFVRDLAYAPRALLPSRLCAERLGTLQVYANAMNSELLYLKRDLLGGLGYALHELQSRFERQHARGTESGTITTQTGTGDDASTVHGLLLHSPQLLHGHKVCDKD